MKSNFKIKKSSVNFIGTSENDDLKFVNENVQTEKNLFKTRLKEIVQTKIDDETFNLVDIANEMNITMIELNKRLNINLGLTQSNKKYSLKVEIALQLLLNNSMRISEVAYELGFNDPKYFSRCFKKETGSTPSEYRRSNLITQSVSFKESNDILFVEKAIKKLETKISDGSLSFDIFASEMNVSKASLYRKLKSVVGLSPCELIRSVRIKSSVRLLNKNNYVADVAFQVGFNDTKYFSRCFKREFGITPTQYQEQLVC